MAVLQEVLSLRDSQAKDLVFPDGQIDRLLCDVTVPKALHVAAGTKEVTAHGLHLSFHDWATDDPGETEHANFRVKLNDSPMPTNFHHILHGHLICF